jgi:hypothetical protein
MLVAITALFFAVGVPVVWAHGGDGTLIHGCVTNTTGAVRLVADPTPYGNANTRCRAGEEHALDWNVMGRSGPAGAPGPKGAQGPQGPAGPTGPAGTSGAASSLPWYETNTGSLEFTGHKDVAQLRVPGGATYLVNATVVAWARPLLDVNCYLGYYAAGTGKAVEPSGGYSWPAIGGEAPIGDYKAPGKQAHATFHVETMHASDVVPFPAARQGAGKATIRIRCYIASYPHVVFGGKSGLTEVRLSAIRIGGPARGQTP